MSGKNVPKMRKYLNRVSLIIPAGILVASAFLSLQPLIRQVFIAVMLIWFGTEAITGWQF